MLSPRIACHMAPTHFLVISGHPIPRDTCQASCMSLIWACGFYAHLNSQYRAASAQIVPSSIKALATVLYFHLLRDLPYLFSIAAQLGKLEDEKATEIALNPSLESQNHRILE